MFIHKHQLEYQLEPRHYCDADFFRDECRTLFEPAWHMVGARSDAPLEGSYLTLELLGRPLMVIHLEGDHHAFLNVCSHRHCRLLEGEAGRSPAFRCQYHGWEYGKDGFTRKIPDAPCFRPFDRENARLKKFRLEYCGELMFVCLADDGPSLRQYLGDVYDLAQARFAAPWVQNWAADLKYDCNWKLPVENTVETYHLPCVHRGYFAGVYPSEAAQTHELDEEYSTLRYDLSEDPSLTARQQWIARRLGGPSMTNTYTHHLRHPHQVFTFSDLYMHAQVYLPISPHRTWSRVRMFSLSSVGKGWWPWVIAGATSWVGARMIDEVQREDAALFEPQQRGLEASVFRGCLGTREERIYAFQRYVRRRVADRPRRDDSLAEADSVEGDLGDSVAPQSRRKASAP